MKRIVLLLFSLVLLGPRYAAGEGLAQGPQGPQGPWMTHAVVLPSTGDEAKDSALLHLVRESLVRTALSYRGLPYLFGGKGPHAYDCSGFLQSVFQTFGIHLPRTSLEQGRAGAPVKLNVHALKPADLIYFKTRKAHPHHVGMYLGRGHFIHAASGRGVVVDSLLESPLRSEVVSISRVMFTVSQLKEMLAKFGDASKL